MNRLRDAGGRFVSLQFLFPPQGGAICPLSLLWFTISVWALKPIIPILINTDQYTNTRVQEVKHPRLTETNRFCRRPPPCTLHNYILQPPSLFSPPLIPLILVDSGRFYFETPFPAHFTLLHLLRQDRAEVKGHRWRFWFLCSTEEQESVCCSQRQQREHWPTSETQKLLLRPLEPTEEPSELHRNLWIPLEISWNFTNQIISCGTPLQTQGSP